MPIIIQLSRARIHPQVRVCARSLSPDHPSLPHTHTHTGLSIRFRMPSLGASDGISSSRESLGYVDGVCACVHVSSVSAGTQTQQACAPKQLHAHAFARATRCQVRLRALCI